MATSAALSTLTASEESAEGVAEEIIEGITLHLNGLHLRVLHIFNMYYAREGFLRCDWQLFPSRLPESIYVPLVWFENDAHKENRTQENAEEAIEFFSGICTFEQTTGKAGEILHVLSWDTDKIDAFLASPED